MKLRIIHSPPTVEEYISLRQSVNWPDLAPEVVKKGLTNAIFSVRVTTEDDKAIGIGRIIGDGMIYFYIQDVIVHPDYRRRGLGRIIMIELMNYLNEHAPNNAFIGLMAAQEVQEFYEKFDFQVRPSSRPGMYKIHKRN